MLPAERDAQRDAQRDARDGDQSFQLLDVRFHGAPPLASAHSLQELLGEDIEDLSAGVQEDARRALADSRRPPARVYAVLYGRARDGKSVAVIAEGFRPSLCYASTPGDLLRDLATLCGVPLAELSATRFEGYPINGGRLDERGDRVPETYVKVTFPSERAWRVAKEPATHLSREAAAGRRAPTPPPTSAALAPQHTRATLDSLFFVESGLRPCGWVRVDGRRATAPAQRATLCDVELLAPLAALTPLQCDALAPLRVLSFDIETVNRKGAMSRRAQQTALPDEHVVCQISLCMHVLGEGEDVKEEGDAGAATGRVDEAARRGAPRRTLLCLRGCAPIAGVDVQVFQSEVTLLHALRRYVVAEDPDVVASYNGFQFDWPYLLTRADGGARGRPACASLAFMGRARFQRVRAVVNRGVRSDTYQDMPGRVNVDVLPWYRARHNEPSYALKEVARKELGDTKNDMPYWRITPCFDGDDDDRAELGAYCVHDAELVRDLVRRKQVLEADMAQAHLSCVMPERLHTHGQTVRVLGQMMVATADVADRPFVWNEVDMAGPAPGKYQGAFVLQPQTGFHDAPVDVLDFASLYPSIMIDHNLCASTLVNKRDQQRPGVVVYRVSEAEVYGYSTRVTGLVPTLLRRLLDARRSIKARRKAVAKDLEDCEQRLRRLSTAEAAPANAGDANAGDANAGDANEGNADALTRKMAALRLEAANLSMQEKAVKVSQNSVYGFFGQKSEARAVASTTTAIGREMLTETIDWMKANVHLVRLPSGRPVGALSVVYGDTDSVFITMEGATTVEDAAAAGKELAARRTQAYREEGYTVKELEFEKCYFPYLILEKKRYVGVKYDHNERGEVVSRGVSYSGGAEKKRDYCRFVQNTYMEMMRRLMEDRDPKGAVAAVKERIGALLDGKVPMEELVMTREVKIDYKARGDEWRRAPEGAVDSSNIGVIEGVANALRPLLSAACDRIAASRGALGAAARVPDALRLDVAAVARALASADLAGDDLRTSQQVRVRFRDGTHALYMPADEPPAHIAVVHKQRERAPGGETQPGDRVKMVFVGGADDPKATMKTRDVVEDYEYAKRESLPLHGAYYLKHQLLGPIKGTLDMLGCDGAALIDAYLADAHHARAGVARLTPDEPRDARVARAAATAARAPSKKRKAPVQSQDLRAFFAP
jgi:DNA polymerase elongation subunit (family B)